MDCYRVVLVDEAKEMLRRIGRRYGKKTYEVIRDLIQDLEYEPEKKGDMLRSPLHGLHSLHYSRFRILYLVENQEARVIVVAAGFHQAGSRDDIYEKVDRWIESGRIVLNPRKKLPP
ncbi:MAG: type II toxin-antitoxin system RelE/ParE family toxin [Phycisphaerae bacterium]